MKKFLMLVFLTLSVSSMQGSVQEFFEGIVDKVNVPVDYFLKIKNIPVVKEFFHERKGQLAKYARYPKLLLTLVFSYKAWKTDTGQKISNKVTHPVKKALGLELKSTKAKKKN